MKITKGRQSMPEPKIAIKIKNVWKIFGDQSEAALADIKKNKITKSEALAKYDCVIGVADVNLEIHRGEIFCIMGLSGSGKSTLVRHINRLLDPSAGEIIVNDRNIMELSDSDLSQYRNEHIAMVFQNFALMPHRSVIDNVALPLEIRGVPKNKRMDIARQALEMVDLVGWDNKFADELSGGMQQRVGLARAIAIDSDILLMDEPFSALDPLIRRQLQGEFMQLAGVMKKTTVFITHDLDEAVRIGNRIAIMRDGRVVQIGTAEEIVLNPADDYVAAFVSGISRLKVVRAKSIMIDISTYKKEAGQIPKESLKCLENSFLNEIIAEAPDSNTPIVVQNKSGKPKGIITRDLLFKAVVEGVEA